MQEQVQEGNPPFSRWDSYPRTSHSAAQSKECKPQSSQRKCNMRPRPWSGVLFICVIKGCLNERETGGKVNIQGAEVVKATLTNLDQPSKATEVKRRVQAG